MSESAKKLSLVVLTGLAFGSSIVFARFALKEIGPFPVTVFRFGIASVFYLFTFIALKKKFPTNWKTLRDMSIVGIIGTGLPLLLFYFALSHLSSGIFTVFLATLPLFTAVLAHLFLTGEKLNKQLILGLTLALFGVFILIATKSSGIVGASFNIYGPLLTLIGVLSAAGGTVYARFRLSREDAFVVSAAQTVAAFIFVFAFVLSIKQFHFGNVSPFGWFSVAYNAIVGSYVAFWLTFTLIKKYGATASALPFYVTPVVSSLLGALLLGEIITIPLLFGAILIVIGLFVSNKKT